MSSIDRTSVDEAWDSLRDEIVTFRDNVRISGAEALEGGRDEKAARALEQAQRLSEFLSQFDAMRRDWQRIVSARRPPASRRGSFAGPPSIGSDLRRENENELATMEAAFYAPILRALDRLGGTARTRAVLRAVEELMSGALTRADREPVSPNRPSKPLWRRTAQRARQQMMNDGLLVADAGEGVWELSAAGRDCLAGSESRLEGLDDELRTGVRRH